MKKMLCLLPVIAVIAMLSSCNQQGSNTKDSSALLKGYDSVAKANCLLEQQLVEAKKDARVKGAVIAELSDDYNKLKKAYNADVTNGIVTIKARSKYILDAVVPGGPGKTSKKSATDNSAAPATATAAAPAASAAPAATAPALVFCLNLGSQGYWPSMAIDKGQMFTDAVDNGQKGYNIGFTSRTVSYEKDYGVTVSGIIYIRKGAIEAYCDGSTPKIMCAKAGWNLSEMTTDPSGNYWIF